MTILQFPYNRVRIESEVHQAKILKMPVREVDPFVAWSLYWMSCFTAPLLPLR